MSSRGVVYCGATNLAYLEAALISAMALRQQEPEISITLISDQPLLKFLPLHSHNITVKFLNPGEIDAHPFSSRQIKTRLNILSPYQETLFLDADILPLQPIQDLWNYITYGDFAMVPDRLPRVALCDHVTLEEKTYTLQRLSGNTTHFNSGVMLWRDTLAVQILFQQWHEEWRKFQKHDQLALVRALHTTQVPVTQLPKTYNVSPIDAESKSGKHQAHLLHCWGGMVASGEFRQFAHNYYPQVVEQVVYLFESCHITFQPAILQPVEVE